MKSGNKAKISDISNLINQWDYTRNDPLDPSTITTGSDKYVWWKCNAGHSWYARISNRANGSGCPYCEHTLPLTGITDLKAAFPKIADEWDFSKNDTLSPNDVLPHSNKYVWWICNNGHSWKAKINNRTTNGTGCPYCSGHLPIVGKTDLQSTHPLLSAEWHPYENGTLTPSDVTSKSNKYVWWRCKNGHEWRTKICHRTEGRGCPYCSGQKAIVGETDLKTINPLLAAEWHPDKNGKKTPSDVTAFSHGKVWWRCSKGHEWLASVYDRSNGRGCPICCGRVVVKGENDFATLFPDVATEWDYEKNDSHPDQYPPHSNQSVFWKCKCGHSWRAKINNRTNGTGCPYCKNNRLIPEETSLAVINPAVAAQWHPFKNGDRTPYNTSAFCNNRVWWRCPKGHEWQATVSNRSNGQGCPICSGHVAFAGYNDLASVNPALAAEWHPTKNGELLTSMVTSHSNKKVWWRCAREGHEWQATVSSRSNGHGCPECLGRKKSSRKHI